MSNETKRDVLEDVLSDLMNQFYFLNVDEKVAKGACSDYVSRYCAALPDDLPVIPKAVSEYTKRMIPILGGPYIRDDVLTEPLFSIFLTIQHNLNKDYPPDFNAENWIIDHSDTFARAWVLGVWRVEETGEIVKLEDGE